jgi:parvulin-like peptidyl-prolyl isomerase
LFLVTGTIAGVVLAASGLIRAVPDTGTAFPADAVATVNGVAVGKDDFNRVVGGLAADRRQPVTAEDRQRILDRLIDEELLIQRALELRLADHDSRIRKDLTVAMVDAIAAPAADLEPTDAELRAFYDDNRAVFSRADHARARQVWCRVATLADAGAAHTRATEAAKRLRAGDDFDAVRTDLGDAEIAPLPDALLPPAKLADYLGPTALRALLTLAPGEVTDPIRSSTGYHVLQLLERAAGEAPPFEEMKPQVLAAFRKEAADQALRDYLAQLRRNADIVSLDVRD